MEIKTKEELKAQTSYSLDDLFSIVKILRRPDGCPWDKEQTHSSIRRDLIEETYEVIEAIDKDSPAMLREELGDLLLQVVFHTCIEEEQAHFDRSDVTTDVCKKLILRHPHVFGDVQADTTAQVLSNWDKIKKVEKNQKSDYDMLDSVSHALPSLIRADKLCNKSKKLGYTVSYDSLPETLGNMMNAEKADADMTEKFGDMLFETVALAKALGIDANQALTDACDRFVEKADRTEK